MKGIQMPVASGIGSGISKGLAGSGIQGKIPAGMDFLQILFLLLFGNQSGVADVKSLQFFKEGAGKGNFKETLNLLNEEKKGNFFPLKGIKGEKGSEIYELGMYFLHLFTYFCRVEKIAGFNKENISLVDVRGLVKRFFNWLKNELRKDLTGQEGIKEFNKVSNFLESLEKEVEEELEKDKINFSRRGNVLEEVKEVIKRVLYKEGNNAEKKEDVLIAIKKVEKKVKSTWVSGSNSKEKVRSKNKGNFYFKDHLNEIGKSKDSLKRTDLLEEVKLKEDSKKKFQEDKISDKTRVINFNKHKVEGKAGIEEIKRGFQFGDLKTLEVEKSLKIGSKEEFSKVLNFTKGIEEKSAHRRGEDTAVRGSFLGSGVFGGSLNVKEVANSQSIQFLKNGELSPEFLKFVKEFTTQVFPNGQQVAVIKLEPPELGKLYLEVKVKDKEVHLTIRAERPEALHELKVHFNHIKTSLEESGMQLKDWNFSLAGGFEGGESLAGGFSNDKRGNSWKSGLESAKVEEVEATKISKEFVNQKGKYYYIV